MLLSVRNTRSVPSASSIDASALVPGQDECNQPCQRVTTVGDGSLWETELRLELRRRQFHQRQAEWYWMVCGGGGDSVGGRFFVAFRGESSCGC